MRRSRVPTCCVSPAACIPTSRRNISCAGTKSSYPASSTILLEDLLNHGLLTASDDRTEWHRPTAESSEAVQLSVLARITVPILERFYLAISMLLRAGSGRLTPGSTRTAVPAGRATHGDAVRAEFSGVLRSVAVRAIHRTAACTAASSTKPATASWCSSRRRSNPSRTMRRSCCTNRYATASCRSCTVDACSRRPKKEARPSARARPIGERHGAKLILA